MPHSQNSPTRIAAAQRHTQALELRLGGATYREIGAALGCSEPRAHQIITEELTRLNTERAETAAEVRRLELERLDALLAGIWPAAQSGDGPAIDRVLSIMGRRARLLGLDVPSKNMVALMSGDHASFDEFSDAELTAIIRQGEGSEGAATPAEGTAEA